jgi:hypothetical protein
MKNLKRLAALTGAAAIVASCQSMSLPGADASAGADNPSLSLAEETTQAANADAAAGGQCSIALAGGPPPKPAKGADFAKNAVGKNVARNAGRNVIAGIGGRLGGGLGGAIAGGIARDQIRTEQDLKGTWMITDGSQDCGCQIDISSGTNMRMQSSNKGRLKPKGCSSLVAGAANWDARTQLHRLRRAVPAARTGPQDGRGQHEARRYQLLLRHARGRHGGHDVATHGRQLTRGG